MIDFLESLSIKERALIYENIEKLIKYKNDNFSFSDKFIKLLQDGIFEFKFDLQNKTSISLYFYEKDQIIIFISGFVKKESKNTIQRYTKSLIT